MPAAARAVLPQMIAPTPDTVIAAAVTAVPAVAVRVVVLRVVEVAAAEAGAAAVDVSELHSPAWHHALT